MRFAVRCAALLAALSVRLSPALPAQSWDAADVRTLIARAIERRSAAFRDSGLVDWSARAHGFVFFLGQIGEGLTEPPRLIKADQLELEVYWRAPNQSKQRILGWRDRRELPTDISYHRDHLGIAMNNFPDLIRLGEGDEVRDVPHPVSPGGPDRYEYALVDSLQIALPDHTIRVYEVRFRPRDFRAPRILGSVFLDVATADLVRMTFSFTRAAYLDPQLEDITVAVENGLWSGRYWLPLRQEIEIRRRATWLDFPARGIIRGRWEIDDYRFNQGVDPSLFASGPEIVAAPRVVLDSFPWHDSLEAAVRDVAQPAQLRDFDAVRAEAVAMAMGHVLTGLRQRQVAAAAVSDFVHVNRVEGIALSAGAAVRSADEAQELRVRVGTATSTLLITGGAEGSARSGSLTWHLAAFRAVRDVGDIAVISRAMNSVTAQEAGSDYGDYYLATGAEAGAILALGGRETAQLALGLTRVDSLAATAEWARGTYRRPNFGVGEGEWVTLSAAFQRRAGSIAARRELTGRAALEGGLGPGDYVRLFAEARLQVPWGPRAVVARAALGLAAGHLPRHRGFVLGGRGTLLGEPFRGSGGSTLAWCAAEWRLPARVPELKLGSFAGTGSHLTLAPNVAIGWTGGRVAGFFATPASGPDAALGLGIEWLHDLLRFDVGYGLRSARAGFAVDVSRDFWLIL